MNWESWARILPLIGVCACPTSDSRVMCAPGCSPSGPLTMVCLDDVLNVEPVKQGIRDWASVLCDRTFAIQLIDGDGDLPVPGCELTILFADSSFDWIASTGPYVLGVADVDRGMAWLVMDRIPDHLVRAVSAHELGHLMGIAQDSDGIMADPLSDGCITVQNVEALP